MAQAIADEYKTSLEDLTFNSKPHINALTMLADEYQDKADVIVRVIEEKLYKALPNGKLPIMYLMDSIVKNVGGNYKPIFAKNIVKSFVSAFEKGDDKVKMSLYKLRSTWDNYFPLKRLYELDVSVQSLDANWPVKPLPASLQEKSASIHVNPKFIKGDAAHASSNTQAKNQSSRASVTPVVDSSDLKQDLINKQKQLLELQQQKLLLELEQTKRQLAEREKKTAKKQVSAVRDPRVKPLAAHRPGMKGPDNGEVRDPRIHNLDKPKVTPNDPRKAAAEINRKTAAVKKPEPEKTKLAEKKSPSDVDKKKKTLTNANKTNTIKSGKSVPKSPKSETPKKSNKKAVGKATKRHSDENKSEEQELSQKNGPGKLKGSKGNKEKFSRRSPTRARPPPAKQPRQSSSVERRKSPPRRNDHQPKSRARPGPHKNDDQRRFSPMSGEGSLSPRFSPEPDEPPVPKRGTWAPSNKRARQHNFPNRPGPQPGMMPNRGPPTVRRRSSVDPNVTIPQELTLGHQAEIMKQAEIQLQTGQITHSQHQDLLKQLHQLFELQRLRNTVGPGFHPEHVDHRMPLDDLLPPQQPPPEHFAQHVENFRPHHSMRFREEFPPHFRPPPSPPRMEEGPHALREQSMTPPPPIPTLDPRRKRRPVETRPVESFQDPRARFAEDHHRVTSPHRSAIEPDSARGQRIGNIYIMDDDDMQSTQSHQHRDYNSGQPMHDTNEGKVPLRAYADGDTPRNRRTSFDSDNLSNAQNAVEKPSVPQTKPDSDNEFEGPQLEEPEDYIIAGIPPGAEAYHEHSMKLQGRSKVSANVIASRRISDAGSGQDKSGSGSEKTDNGEGLMSPDVLRDKMEDLDELTKSPSLPLKKRKYIVSSTGANDSEATNESESETRDKNTQHGASKSDNQSVDIDHEDVIADESVLSSKAEEPGREDKTQDGLSKEIPPEVSDKNAASEVPPKLADNVDVKPHPLTDHRRKSQEREIIPPLMAKPIIEQRTQFKKEENSKKKRKKDRREKMRPQPYPAHRRQPEGDLVVVEEERRLKQLMMEEEERLRWEAQLEMELGREEFAERERMGRGRGMRRSPPRIWGRDEGPFRGRGPPPGPPPPPPGRGRRFEREFWGNEPPPFPGRPPHIRPPMHPFGEREWDRHEGHRHDHPPLPRPRHDIPRREWPPRGTGRDRSPNRTLPPPERPQPPAEINQVNVNKLLFDLMAKGIIPSEGKSNEPQQTPETHAGISTEPKIVHSASAPVLGQEESSLPKNEQKREEVRVPTPVFDDIMTTDPNENLPDVNLTDSDKLKIRNDDVIVRLYTGIQCSACGMRFTACQTDMYAEHLDWHYRLNRKDKEGTRETHRLLYPSAGEWIMYEEIADPSQREKSQVFDEVEEDEGSVNEMQDENELVVPVAQNPEQDRCAVCNEAFTTVYNDEEEEWQYIRCVAVSGKNFHPACYADHTDRDDENAPPPPTPIRVPIYNPLSVAADGIPGLDSLTAEKDTPDNVAEVEKPEEALLPALVQDSDAAESTSSSENAVSESTPVTEKDIAPCVNAEESMQPIQEDPTPNSADEPQIQSEGTTESVEVLDSTSTAEVSKMQDDTSPDVPTTSTISDTKSVDSQEIGKVDIPSEIISSADGNVSSVSSILEAQTAGNDTVSVKVENSVDVVEHESGVGSLDVESSSDSSQKCNSSACAEPEALCDEGATVEGVSVECSTD